MKPSITLLPTPGTPVVTVEAEEKPIRLEIPSPAPGRARWDSPRPVEAIQSPVPGHHGTASVEADFTDADLRDALAPILEQVVRGAVNGTETGLETDLEPMLRATIRRALAEYSPASRPFRPPGTFDRFVWHLQALFTSRTYEEILFEKTHRFQVEEVFLVDVASLALISFASCDPARHASAKRISSTVQRLALQVRDEEGKIRDTFELPEQRHVVARAGKHVVLMAVVRGMLNDLVLADLEFSLRRIEDRFHQQFLQEGSPLLHPLQPFLEDCLLIQAPASAA